jgi:hypothetical protein
VRARGVPCRWCRSAQVAERGCGTSRDTAVHKILNPLREAALSKRERGWPPDLVDRLLIFSPRAGELRRRNGEKAKEDECKERGDPDGVCPVGIGGG